MHMRDLLFDHPKGLRLKARAQDVTAKGDRKVDKHVIKRNKESDPVLLHVSEFNRLKHKYGTFVEGFRKKLHERRLAFTRHFLRTSYRQDVARTHRLTSRAPNLQTIPNRGFPEDKAIRRMFVPHVPGDLEGLRDEV